MRLVLGVSTSDIARLFLTSESTVAARITRAKKKILAAGIPFSIPDADALPERLDTVAQTAYLAFTAAYNPGSGADLLRADLAGEAIRLVRVVVELCPDAPAPRALLALMLLLHSRRDARVAHGRLVLLPDQDRSLWRRDEIDEALSLLSAPTLSGPVSPLAASYVLQTRIAAEHATAAAPQDTRWDRIVDHFDLLLRVFPSPSARLARAVAVAEAFGPQAGLDALEGVELPGSHRVAAVRAELLSRCGEVPAARAAFDEAIRACTNDGERAHLVERHRSLPGGAPP